MSPQPRTTAPPSDLLTVFTILTEAAYGQGGIDPTRIGHRHERDSAVIAMSERCARCRDRDVFDVHDRRPQQRRVRVGQRKTSTSHVIPGARDKRASAVTNTMFRASAKAT